MSPVTVMVGMSAASWLVVLALAGRQVAFDVLLGMLGPLAAVIGTWVLVERRFRQRPETLSSVMAGAFAIKLVFFGVYVAAVILLVSVRPVPFAAGFASYFIALYAVEAIYLRRLFAGGARPAR